jgi:hypothetical protein
MRTGLTISSVLIDALLLGLVIHQNASLGNLEYRVSAMQRLHSQVDRLQRETYDLTEREEYDRSIINSLEDDLAERAGAYCHMLPQGKECKEVLALETGAGQHTVK